MLSRRTFLSLVAGSMAAPGLAFAQQGSQKVALYANVGSDLTHYDVDVAGAELIKRETVTLPAAVQYAWPHASRRRCWRYDWVLDLDIKSFFDEIDRELLMRAVRKHTDCPWVLLYLERWLRAPVQMADGSLISRERGTPQGGVVTPRTQKVTSALIA
jgi:hypothetical protein